MALSVRAPSPRAAMGSSDPLRCVVWEFIGHSLAATFPDLWVTVAGVFNEIVFSSAADAIIAVGSFCLVPMFPMVASVGGWVVGWPGADPHLLLTQRIHEPSPRQPEVDTAAVICTIAWQDPELGSLQGVLEAYGSHFVGVDSRLELVQGYSLELSPGQAVVQRRGQSQIHFTIMQMIIHKKPEYSPKLPLNTSRVWKASLETMRSCMLLQCHLEIKCCSQCIKVVRPLQYSFANSSWRSD